MAVLTKRQRIWRRTYVHRLWRFRQLQLQFNRAFKAKDSVSMQKIEREKNTASENLQEWEKQKDFLKISEDYVTKIISAVTAMTGDDTDFPSVKELLEKCP